MHLLRHLALAVSTAALYAAPSVAQTLVSPALLGADAPRITLTRQAPRAEFETTAKDAGTRTQQNETLLNELDAANQAAEQNKVLFRALLREYSSTQAGLVLPESDVGNAVKTAARVANEQDFEREYISGREGDATYVRRVRMQRSELLRRVAEATPAVRQAAVYADGSIRGNASGSESSDGVGTGSLGVAIRRRNELWFASMTIASTTDTVGSGFGAALLSPGSGRALASGLIDLHLPAQYRQIGLHGYTTASRSRWRLSETTVTDATILGGGLLGYHQVAEGSVGNSTISLVVEAGPMVRWLAGDIRSIGAPDRENAIGSADSFFGGLETGATLSIGELVGAVQLYHVWPTNRDDFVSGLSGLQLVAGFSVKGRLFGGALGGGTP